MEKDEINYLLLYKKPISESILEYATDNFTKNNAHKLLELSEDKNRNELLTVIIELIDWYKSNIDVIKKDRFVFKKEDHMRSYDMLQCIKTQLSSHV
jgi:hypothetical protein